MDEKSVQDLISEKEMILMELNIPCTKVALDKSKRG